MERPTEKQIKAAKNIARTLDLELPQQESKLSYQAFIAINLPRAQKIWRNNKAAARSTRQSRRPYTQSQREANFIGLHCGADAILEHLENGGKVPYNCWFSSPMEGIRHLRAMGARTSAERLREREENERWYDQKFYDD